MKCPNDKTEMEEGGLASHGNRWAEGGNRMLRPMGKPDRTVFAYRCPKCGKVELTTEVK